MSEEIMSQEAFDEIIDNLEHIKTLTDYGKKGIKYNIKKLQKELQQEKEKNEALENKNASLNKEIKLMKSVNINDNYISKDKIKAKIKELEPELRLECFKNEAELQINLLKKILEEE